MSAAKGDPPGDDTVEIRSGGAIEVDSDAMRDAARQMRVVVAMVERASDGVGRARHAIGGSTLPARADFGGLDAVGGELDDASELLRRSAEGTGLMADAFEYADLQARQRALQINFPDRADALQERIDALAASDPRVATMAAYLLAQWQDDRYDGTAMPLEVALLGDHAPLGLLAESLLMPLGTIAGGLRLAFPFLQRKLIGTANDLGRGVMVPGERLLPKADPPNVTVKQVPVTAATAAPTTVQAALQRVPADSKAQVRIERYALRDGSRRFRLYVDGTQAALGDDPWNMQSNLDMYLTRTQGASDVAVHEAMRQAGVQPGDTLDLVTYSQGGFTGADIAMSGEYDVRTFVSAGGPVEPTLDDSTQIVQLRHGDDPVGNGLSGNGSAGTTGSDDSFIARRDAGGRDASAPSLDDLRIIEPHLFERYLDTAGMVDDSRDPKVAALYENWRAYEDATDVETFLFRAEIVDEE
ncbi:hypothetical protein [Microbacterium sp. NPDC057650]|uniref:hypothetical protein n=1 Tax=unclassified Microbacterium TaxID=2609290 RepID=UPI0036702E56